MKDTEAIRSWSKAKQALANIMSEDPGEPVSWPLKLRILWRNLTRMN